MTWSKANGSTRRYRKLRQKILERDSPDGNAAHARCQLAYPDRCLGKATTLHHTKPWDGDPADINPDDAIAACFPCNHHAGQPTNPDPEPKPWNP